MITKISEPNNICTVGWLSWLMSGKWSDIHKFHQECKSVGVRIDFYTTFLNLRLADENPLLFYMNFDGKYEFAVRFLLSTQTCE